jgi:hypothetical protein
MFDTSYRLILFSLLAMVIAGGLLYLETATIVAYALLLIGFFGIGIGILIGFFKMINDSN